MDCTQAQEILSAAVDQEAVSPEMLAEARAHCRQCPECARFVRGLATMQRAEPPLPAPDLFDRVMSAVEAERSNIWPEHEAVPDDVTAVAAAAADSALTDQAQQLPPRSARTDTATHPRWFEDARTLTWLAAAAVVILAVGVITMFATRGISPSRSAVRSSSAKSQDTATSGSPLESAGGASETPTTATGPAVPLASRGVPQYITVNGIAYSSGGSADFDASQLTLIGTTMTALDKEDSPKEYRVYGTPVPGRAVILTPAGMLAFDVASRKKDGQTYVLTSSGIDRFGVWPSLPEGFTQPASPEGAPAFSPDGADDLGVSVFSKPGVPIEQGFAVGPGTTESDPAKSNPNWTWWALPAAK